MSPSLCARPWPHAVSHFPTAAVPSPASCPAPSPAPHQHPLVHLVLLQVVFQGHQPEGCGAASPWPWEHDWVLHDKGQRDDERCGGVSTAPWWGTAAQGASLVHLCLEEELPPQPWGCAVLQGGTGGAHALAGSAPAIACGAATCPKAGIGRCVPLRLLWVFGVQAELAWG